LSGGDLCLKSRSLGGILKIGVDSRSIRRLYRDAPTVEAVTSGTRMDA
jgi:hypothetical protein